MANTPADGCVCPVCREPAVTGNRCPGCDWILEGPVRLGPAPAAYASHFRADLHRASQGHDLRAAERAATAAGPEPLDGLRRLLGLVRGGPGSEARLPRRPNPPATDLGALPAALRGSDAYAHLSFLLITPDGLALWTAADGPPALVRETQWTELGTLLPTDRDRRLFHLAGGIGTKPPVDRAVWDVAVAEAITATAGRHEGPLLLVEPPEGWGLLERAARVAHKALRPAATMPWQSEDDLARTAERIRRALPRPEGYDVLVGRLDTAGQVRAQRVAVFAPEVVDDGGRREAKIVVHGTAQGGEVIVPLLRHGLDAADPSAAAGAVLLSLASGERAVITAEQETPGTVRLHHPRARPAPDWRALVSSLDVLLRSGRDEPIDVVVTVELGRPDAHAELTAERKQAAAAVLERLITLTDGRRSLRAGVVGYGDHLRRWPAKLTVEPLGAPWAAVSALAGMDPAQAVSDLVAPLEDALSAAGAMTWQPGARKLVIAVAGRAPHPPEQRPYLPVCPIGHRIDEVVAGLPAGLAVLPLLIGEPAGGSGLDGGWTEQSWTRLSPRPPATSAEQCARQVEALLVPEGKAQHLRLALAAPAPRKP